MGEKLRYLDYLKKADTPSPARSWSDVVFVNDECGTPTFIHRKMTVKIRTRDGVERFQLNGVRKSGGGPPLVCVILFKACERARATFAQPIALAC